MLASEEPTELAKIKASYASIACTCEACTCINSIKAKFCVRRMHMLVKVLISWNMLIGSLTWNDHTCGILLEIKLVNKNLYHRPLKNYKLCILDSRWCINIIQVKISEGNTLAKNQYLCQPLPYTTQLSFFSIVIFILLSICCVLDCQPMTHAQPRLIDGSLLRLQDNHISNQV